MQPAMRDLRVAHRHFSDAARVLEETQPLYQLAPQVFACKTGRNYMFLDLRQDQYLSVPQSLMNELAPHIANWSLPLGTVRTETIPRAHTRTLADDLITAGILIPIGPDQHPALTPPAPHAAALRSALDSLYSEPPHRHRLSALSALLHADFLLHTSTLWRIAHQISARSENTPHEQGELQALSAAFLRVRAWYPRNYLCLFDSLALILFLLNRGIRAQWVFGVREDPFAAHCWVQYDHVVLNEYLDRALLYTPIMIV